MVPKWRGADRLCVESVGPGLLGFSVIGDHRRTVPDRPGARETRDLAQGQPGRRTCSAHRAGRGAVSRVPAGHLEHLTSALRAALISAIAFAACHSFLALSVTEVGWPILLFTLVEGLVCAFVRMRYGVSAAINPSRQGHAGQERPQGLQLDRI